MARELPPGHVGEIDEWNQWEIVDIETQPKQINGPEKSDKRSANTNNKSQSNHDNEEKEGVLRYDAPQDYESGNDNEDDRDIVGDLREQYKQQQRQLQREKMKHRHLTRKMEKSMSVAQQQQQPQNSNPENIEVFRPPSPNNRIRQMQYESIIADSQTSLKKLETEKEDSQRIVDELLRANEELKKKLDEVNQQKEYDKQYKLRREQEFAKELERSKQENRRAEMERTIIEKDKELVEKEKELVKKEMRQLLLLQQQQQQQQQQQPIPKNASPSSWKCQLCGNNNNIVLQHCKSCEQIQFDGQLLTIEGILNDGEWNPCEEQEYGWILQNHSAMPIKIQLKLVRVESSPKDLVICEEGMLVTYEARGNEELYVVVNARAPSLCGKYHASWQMMTQDNRKIGPVLDMKLVVKSNLKSKQEEKVKQMMCEYGFKDRDVVVAVLIASNWNVDRAVQQLVDQSGVN